MPGSVVPGMGGAIGAGAAGSVTGGSMGAGMTGAGIGRGGAAGATWACARIGADAPRGEEEMVAMLAGRVFRLAGDNSARSLPLGGHGRIFGVRDFATRGVAGLRDERRGSGKNGKVWSVSCSVFSGATCAGGARSRDSLGRALPLAGL